MDDKEKKIISKKEFEEAFYRISNLLADIRYFELPLNKKMEIIKKYQNEPIL